MYELCYHPGRVAALPAITACLASGRRRRFGMGLLRRYPELDGE